MDLAEDELQESNCSGTLQTQIQHIAAIQSEERCKQWICELYELSYQLYIINWTV